MNADTPSGIAVTRCADDSRRGDILALVHEAFGGLSPPSGALNETIDDVAARFAAGPVLIAEAGGELIGSVYGAVKEGGLYLTRMAVRPDWQKCGVGRALLKADLVLEKSAEACFDSQALRCFPSNSIRAPMGALSPKVGEGWKGIFFNENVLVSPPVNAPVISSPLACPLHRVASEAPSFCCAAIAPERSESRACAKTNLSICTVPFKTTIAGFLVSDSPRSVTSYRFL